MKKVKGIELMQMIAEGKIDKKARLIFDEEIFQFDESDIVDIVDESYRSIFSIYDIEKILRMDFEILENFTEQTVIYGSTVGMTLEKYKDLQLSIKHILSDYKKLQEEINMGKKIFTLNKEEKRKIENISLEKMEPTINEFLKKDIKNKYVAVAQIVIRKQKEENKKLKEYLKTQNYEINRLNLENIEFKLSQLPDMTERYKNLKNEYKMRLERTGLDNYKSNYILKSRIQDLLREVQDYDLSYKDEILFKLLQKLLKNEE